MADEHECARAARLLAGISGERGLPDAGVAAKNDKAAMPGECRAELRKEQAALLRASDQK
jgi:hypothetical protein